MKNNFLSQYTKKMRGYDKCPKHENFSEIFWSSLGCFVTIVLISFIDTSSQHLFTEQPLFVAPVGASTIMIFGLPNSIYAQPRNVIGGHFIAALCGVTALILFRETEIFACAIAVMCTMLAMHATKTIHPPGGATALLAVIGGESITNLGYLFAFVPCLTNSIMLIMCGIIFNNIPKSRQYPRFWI